jgi:hypothetical protein
MLTQVNFYVPKRVAITMQQPKNEKLSTHLLLLPPLNALPCLSATRLWVTKSVTLMEPARSLICQLHVLDSFKLLVR